MTEKLYHLHDKILNANKLSIYECFLNMLFNLSGFVNKGRILMMKKHEI